MANRHLGQSLPLEILTELRAVAARLGERTFLAELGLSADTAARVLAGYPCHRGTHAAVQLFLDQRRKAA